MIIKAALNAWQIKRQIESTHRTVMAAIRVVVCQTVAA
jgi:hypothetical protein